MAHATLTMRGTAPLLMHNTRLADPLDPIVREMKPIMAKRSRKTDEDREALARLEYVGGLYFDPDVGPFVPGENVRQCLRGAAKRSRRGDKVQAGVLVPERVNPLGYTGPRDLDELWKDANFRTVDSVVVERKRIMRTRPMFRDWALSVEIEFDPEIIDRTELEEFARLAGSIVGIGDWRPVYGRFAVEFE